jgi:hypothetical protein
MGRASAAIDVPGLASDAEALWYDPARWPAWIDGFGHVVELADGWPAEGRLVWESRPGGRGRVLERVTAYEPRAGQSVAVEDARVHGVQRVAFEPAPDHVRVRLTLRYELKERHMFTWAVDRFFVRRAFTESLRRTLTRFAQERHGELELTAVTSR